MSGLTDSAPLPPRFKLVALDETHCWSDEVVAVTGRIQGIYLYDESRAIHCAELTPSYWLLFLYNVSENPIGDYEGDENPMVPGFDSATEFEHENGGEHGIYVHCSSIDRLASEFKYDCGPVDEQLLAEYLAADEADREKLYQDMEEGFREHYLCNRMFEGHFPAKEEEAAK